MKKRNSLIELCRFIFAINVIKSHALLPYDGPYFGPGRISVEFFFILTGYLLIKSMKKHLDKPFKKSIIDFFASKLKLIGIPVLIAIPFNIIYSVITKGNINIWGFLWYVHQMLNCFAIFFIIRYFVKNEKVFFAIIALTAILATTLNVFPEFYELGIVRALMGISIGMLLSYIPPLKIKKCFIWMLLIPIQIAIIYILTFGIGHDMIIEKLLHIFLYPLLIYLTFQLEIDNKFFNYLGSLSFGLYAFQCVARPLPLFGLENVWILFGIIVLLTLLEDALKRYLKYNENKKMITS